MARYIPKQHGAWAMLVLPFLAGLAISEGKIIHIPLFLWWLVIYLFSFPVLQWIKTGNKARYRGPALLYGVILLPLTVILIAFDPMLIGYGVLLLVFFIPNIYYAKTKNERALLNDIMAVLVFCSFIFPVVYVGEGGSRSYVEAAQWFALLAAYFIGTVLYVKTVIREKNNPRFYYASITYHLLNIGIAAAVNLYMIFPAVILLLRAAWFPKLGLKVKQTGMAEFGFASLIYVSILFIYA
ncbi:YwiC-like family protein [Paenibacillus physcomitrellae]|uniref:Membrane protein n=1 Tax=Paenibacillus physcomitrellae TaxID=1619311 RepID=A0ABQ1FUE6_9BACL|nr:YwiC-like family protein [Paenibacillus physcomitrellae]GGA30286.1 membrane protein [Paenibacillus physcomitrellae]